MPITGSQKAKMVARLGIMRLGASRLDYYNPIFLITINGVSRSTTGQVRIAGVSIRDLLDGTPNTATMRVDGFTPSKGHEVKIALGQMDVAHMIFAGHILSVQQSYEGEKRENVAWDLDCISYEWLLTRRKVTRKYTSAAANTIAFELVRDFSSGFTWDGVVAGLPTIDEITFTNEDLPDALDRTAKRVGASWLSDYGKDVKFFVTSTETANSITDAQKHTARAIAQRVDLSQVRTRVYVEGGGGQALAAVAAGSPSLPVDTTSWYPSSGVVISGPQRIAYGAKGSNEGQGSTIAGKPLSPGTPSASVVANTAGNLSVGAYQYKTSFVTPQGDSELGSASSAAAIAHVTPPSGFGSLSETTGGSLTTLSRYGYVVSYGTAAGETLPQTSSASEIDLTGSNNAVNVTSLATSSDGRVTKRLIYRANYTSGSGWKLVKTINDNSTTSFTDTLADSAGGIAPPTVNTSGSGQISLSSISTGPTGTTARKLWRTEANGSAFFLALTIGDNSTTTATDNVADTALGADAPTASEVGASPGDTTLRVKELSVFSPTGSGGWVSVGDQTLLYTGKSLASGEGTLLGIPASGGGSITSVIPYGTSIVIAPHLIGISPTDDTRIKYPIAAGDDVNLLIERNDGSAQTAMASYVGGDGIHEEVLQDRRLSETEAIDRADAHLTLVKDPLVTMSYQTRDPSTKSGRSITFSLGAPTNISGTFKIQSVTISEFDPLGRTFPLRAVEASSRRLSFEAILRLLKAAA